MTGRKFAYAGVLVGLSISVAANVMHARVDPKAPGWAPYLAAAWPLLLFLALEVLTRTVWSSGRGVKVARVGVAVVAGVAAALSYWHLRGLLVTAGEDGWAATLGPLAIDGLMGVSAAALLNEVVEPAPVVSVAPVEITEPEPVPTWLPAAVPLEASPVAELGPLLEAELAPPEPVLEAPRRPRPVGKAAAPRASDDDLLARLDAAVAAGELTPDQVTRTGIRARYGVGSDRAGRLADTWHAQHRRRGLAVAP